MSTLNSELFAADQSLGPFFNVCVKALTQQGLSLSLSDRWIKNIVFPIHQAALLNLPLNIRASIHGVSKAVGVEVIWSTLMYVYATRWS